MEVFPRVVVALAAAEASGAEVRPLLEVAFALERTVLTGVLVCGVWVAASPLLELDLAVVTVLEGVSVVVVARLVPVFVCLRAVLVSALVEVPLLRRAAVPVLLPLLLVPLLRFTWAPELLPVVVPVLFPVLPRRTWVPELLPVVVPVLLPVLPRRTWVEVLPVGAAVFRFAVLVWRVAVPFSRLVVVL